MVLRVSLDGVVTLDSCAEISKTLSDWLDGIEVPAKRYSLEVSSLGIDRPLRNEAEFAEHIGKYCKLSVKTKGSDGRKRYGGKIIKVESGNITLLSEDEGREFIIPADDIAKANLDIKDGFGE
jgi:ribosome maturation factor RimP